MVNYVKEGNTCLFLLFIVTNACQLVAALGIVGLGAYCVDLTSSINTIAILFFVIGILPVIISVWGCSLRKSIAFLGVYLVINAVLLFVQLVFTIVFFVDEDKLINLAADKMKGDSQQEIEQIRKKIHENLTIV